jgi:hypothetical protein
MSDIDPSAEELELTVNPGVDVQVHCIVRRRGQPLKRLRLDSERDLSTLRWLLAQGTDEADKAEPPPLPTLQRALSLGLVVRPDEVPARPLPFSCELDEGLLSLVPPRLLKEFAAWSSDPAGVTWNDGIVLQRTPALPAAVATSVITGPQLWRHLGKFEPPIKDPFPSSPTIWVANPSTGLQQPVWGGAALPDDRLIALIEGRGGDLAATTAEERLFLALAELLVPRDRRDATPSTPARGIVKLGRVLAPLQIAALRRHYRSLRLAGYFDTDDTQVREMRDGTYCEYVSLLFQNALVPALSAALRRSILPSYTWVYRYRPGAVLERHVDRPQCRWNVSLCLDLERDDTDIVDWPLFFEVDGERLGVNLQMGEAVLYSGTDTPHWRERSGERDPMTMAFFHYVDVDFAGSRD